MPKNASDKVLTKDEWELEESIASLIEKGLLTVFVDKAGVTYYKIAEGVTFVDTPTT